MGFFQIQLLCFIFAIIFIRIGQVTVAQPTYTYHVCQGANYTSNSQFQRNLNLTMSSLSSNIKVSRKFYNNSNGQSPDKVYGILLCRGYLTNKACNTCADTATREVTQRCPNNKEFISWYDDCMLRYSNKNIFSVMQVEPSVSLFSIKRVTNQERFSKKLSELVFLIISDLMEGLIRKASSNGSDFNARFSTVESNTTFYQKIDALVQCTPDISGSDCNRCLTGAVERLPSCCFGRQGGRVLRPSCHIRYETYPFYESTATAPPPFPVPPNDAGPSPFPLPLDAATINRKGNKPTGTIVTVVVVFSVVAALILLSTACFCSRRKRRAMEKFDDVDEIKNAESLQFDFGTIIAATDNFSVVNKVGKGGFGPVYKGRLPDGQEIAVKRLSRSSAQGVHEFKNEVLLVAKLQHRNLVKLLGFCVKDEEKLLIYQFVPNASLDHFIFDPIKRAHLNWERRYKIIRGIARGILYLHEDSRLRIIHRDLKASNVLLDEEMNPKIADFGMARLCVVDQTQGSTDRIVGTYGYMAPEYAMHGQFSVKSDVYSFGVLVLEIVSGHKNNSLYELDRAEDLPSYAWRHRNEGKALELLDPTLRNCFSESEVMSCIQIALLCVQDEVDDRPTMASIDLMLTGYSAPLPLPFAPAFFARRKMERYLQPTSSSKSLSVNELSVTELYPR